MTPDPEPPDLTAPLVPPVEEAVVADQVAAQATEPGAGHGAGHHAPLHTHCENCGTELRGPFCHRCGQHDFDFKQGFSHAVHDALENFFHFDTKLFRNTVTLLFRPGRLSAAFNAGHRAAQMPPLRLYIFVSLLFFFVSFAGSKTSEVADLPTMDGEARQELDDLLGSAKHKDPAKAADIERVQAELAKDAPAHAAASAKPAAKKAGEDSEFEQTMREKGAYALTHQRELAETFVHSIPKMLLVCLPCFALYTRFLFRKAGLAYLQHVVIALHFHTFIFLWILCRNGWGELAGLASGPLRGAIVFACNLWLLLYPLLMLRHLFGNSWKRTLVKTGLLVAAYACTLGTVFLAAAILIFATI